MTKKSFLICVFLATVVAGLTIQLAKRENNKLIPIEKFSDESLKKYLDEEYFVLVVVRSELSMWADSLLKEENVRGYLKSRKVIALDLVWSWDGKNLEAQKYFNKFGFDKEAFIVFFSPNEEAGIKLAANFFSSMGKRSQ